MDKILKIRGLQKAPPDTLWKVSRRGAELTFTVGSFRRYQHQFRDTSNQ